MAYQDYYDWVREAMDLYGMDYVDAQGLWRDVADETGERPVFDHLYDPDYGVDELVEVEEPVDYQEWVHEAMDLYGMDYRDAQTLWSDVADLMERRPTYDDLEYVGGEDGEVDVAEWLPYGYEPDYGLGAWDDVDRYDGYDEWWDEWYGVGEEVEITVKYSPE